MIEEKKKNMLQYYNKGIEAYFARDFKSAMEYFKKALEVDPDDGPSRLHYLRCKEYIKNPPPENWDGVFTMKTK